MLKTVREKAGLTQEQLASSVGVTTRAVHKWEKLGIRHATLGNAEKVAKTLKCEIADLLQEPSTKAKLYEDAVGFVIDDYADCLIADVELESAINEIDGSDEAIVRVTKLEDKSEFADTILNEKLHLIACIFNKEMSEVRSDMKKAAAGLAF